MSYDIHITRAADWIESEANPITAEEWLRVIQADRELNSLPDYGPYFALWRGNPADPSGPWFDWKNGQVYSEGADEAAIKKAIRIARLLNAHVLGDDSEEYRLNFFGCITVSHE